MEKSFRANLAGMTIMEIIVTIALIAMLASVTLVALTDVREQSRDSQRISDVTQIQVALSAFKRDTGLYPTAITGGQQIKASNTVYMAKMPNPPTPQDGTCGLYPVYASYYYVPAGNLKNYDLYFCLGGQTSDVTSGANKAMPNGIVASTTP